MPQSTESDAGAVLLAAYDRLLPEVYGYLLPRCGGAVALAEDLTSETFLAAVAAINVDGVADPTVAWLIGIARHKLVDHWRRRARDERVIEVLEGGVVEADDPWDEHVDAIRMRRLLTRLGAHHRSALTLRYVDGLSVPEVAALLDRTVHATEALLVRARRALRILYQEGSDDA